MTTAGIVIIILAVIWITFSEVAFELTLFVFVIAFPVAVISFVAAATASPFAACVVAVITVVVAFVAVGFAVHNSAYARGIVGFLGFLGVCSLLGGLHEVVVGLVAGAGVVGAGFLTLLAVTCITIELRQRRIAQIPVRLRAVISLAPRTLRWVHCLLPGDEGAVWLAEVTSCLDDIPDKGERRRYLRSHRRSVPHLIWTSWAVHRSVSRRRELL